MTREEAIEKVRQMSLPRETREILEALVPELAESEDERIRKDILCFLKAKLENYTAPTPAKSTLSMWIDYLEKQKESLHIPETCKENAGSFTDEDERIRAVILKLVLGMRDEIFTTADKLVTKPKVLAWLEKQKEHQFCSDAPKEKSVGGDFLSSHKDKDLDEIAQDYVDRVKEYNPEPTWDLMQTAVCYGYHYREEEEQKPQSVYVDCTEHPEWYGMPPKEQKPNIEICPHSIKSKSYKENGYPIEDCDYGLEIAFDILEKTFGDVRGYQTDDGIREHQTAIEAVRKAKEQKPVEFPLKDKVFSIMKKLNSLNFMLKLGSNEERLVNEITSEVRDLADYSIDKPAEWSEEDEETLNYIINVLDRFGFEEYCKSSRDQDVEEERFFYKEIQVLKKLKSLRPSWKPSKEQIDAIVEALKYLPNNKDEWMVLNTLADVLRKLM